MTILSQSDIEDRQTLRVINSFLWINQVSKIETFYKDIDDERGPGLMELVFSFPKTSEIYLNTDIEKITQALKKLIYNALKFTQQGTLEVGCFQPDDHHIEFYVHDTGIGIPSDKFDIIFELFRMADESPGRQYGGSGLGLYIAHRLLTLLGANIDLQSEVGVGTRVSFTLNTDNQ